MLKNRKGEELSVARIVQICIDHNDSAWPRTIPIRMALDLRTVVPVDLGYDLDGKRREPRNTRRLGPHGLDVAFTTSDISGSFS